LKQAEAFSDLYLKRRGQGPGMGQTLDLVP